MTSDGVREAATEMWISAKRHNNRYLLPRRICLNGSDRSGDPERDLLYDAAHWLVEAGYATWIDPASSMRPGIDLTMRGLTDDRHAHTQRAPQETP